MPFDAWMPFLNGLSYLESNSNPRAKNPKSSATGGFQFINGTANQAIQAGLPDPRAGDMPQQTQATQAFIRRFNPRAAAALDKGDMGAASELLKGTWPSLPGGSQPQSAERYAKFAQLTGMPMPGGVSGGAGQETVQGGAPATADPMTTPSQGFDPMSLLKQGGANKPYDWKTSDWGSALQSAGASLAAASNPQAAAVLSNQANQSRSQNTDSVKQAIEFARLMKPDFHLTQDNQGVSVGPNGKATTVYQGAPPTTTVTTADAKGAPQIQPIFTHGGSPAGAPMKAPEATRDISTIGPNGQPTTTVIGANSAQPKGTFGGGEVKYMQGPNGAVLKINPDGTTGIAHDFGTKSDIIKETDMLGNESHFAINPWSLKREDVTPEALKNSRLTPQTFEDIAELQRNGATIPQMLEKAPAALRGFTDALLTGNEPPGGWGVSKEIKTAAHLLAQTVQPGTNMNTYDQRRTIMNDYAKSTASSFGGTVKSLGTFGEHLGTVADAFQDLWNKGNVFDGNLIVWNEAAKRFEAATGHPEYNRIANAVNTYATEKDRFISGKPSTDHGRAAGQEFLAANKSPDQIKTALAGDATMVLGRQEQNEAQWKTIMRNDGPLTNPDGSRGFIPQKSMEIIKRLSALDPVMNKTNPMSPVGGPANMTPQAPVQWGRDKNGKPIPMVAPPPGGI